MRKYKFVSKESGEGEEQKGEKVVIRLKVELGSWRWERIMCERFGKSIYEVLLYVDAKEKVTINLCAFESPWRGN